MKTRVPAPLRLPDWHFLILGRKRAGDTVGDSSSFFGEELAAGPGGQRIVGPEI